MIKNKALGIVKLRSTIKKDGLNYKLPRRKLFTCVFMRNIHTGRLELKNADDEQSTFANELKRNLDKGTKSDKKCLF